MESSQKEISVICPSCKRSVIVEFTLLSNLEIDLDCDTCIYCDCNWKDDIIEQICEDLEDELEYDQEIEHLRQEEYNYHLNGRIFEYFEN
jgi:hypothetical protein